MSKDLVALVRCWAHWQHPDRTGRCQQCRHAISLNRVRNGWGMHYEFVEGLLITWETYQPITSWSGPDAFMKGMGG